MNKAPHSEAAFFDAKYAGNPDPWNFEEDAYERGRYEAILKAISGNRYAFALEAGCSIGILTLEVAKLCANVLAIDFSQVAAGAAMHRCQGDASIEVRCQALEDVVSFEPFDLIILSEIGYYFSEAAWASLSLRISSEISTGCTILAAHWLGFSKDHEMSGDRVHEILHANGNLVIQQSVRYSGFRLDLWKRL